MLLKGQNDDALDDDKVEHPGGRSEKSTLAAELDDLKSTVIRFSRERERLPQPLFWSLFRSRIEKARKEKEVKRALGELLGEG